VPKVLIIEDDDVIADGMSRHLVASGFDPVWVNKGESGLARLRYENPDVCVLDLMLPGMDGIQLCRWIRGRSELPVIMLTARAEEADRIVGLELGADDYVTKPFSPRELAARVRTVLRRASPSAGPPERIVHGDLELDGAGREVTKAGALLRLTAKEFDLLWFFAAHPRRVFSRDQLMDRVWGYEPAFDTGTVTVHVRRLREKIEDDPSKPRHLETVWGIGYRFCP
jgi:DNA-binding response OmpR family regulator